MDTFITIGLSGYAVRISDIDVWIQKSDRAGIRDVTARSPYVGRKERDMLVAASVVEALRLSETAEEIRLAGKIAEMQS